MIARLLASIAVLATLAPDRAAFIHAQPAPLADHPFALEVDADVVATIRAGCERCDWSAAGREAASLVLTVDGRYSQHLLLVRGEAAADYRVMLGRQPRGRHALAIALDQAGSARSIGRTIVESVTVMPIGGGSDAARALAMAPFLHARPDTVGRFTDVPVLMWYETVPTPRGRQFRYSVIFTNEDGGTPTDRLMATWGRTTDIEYVYGVELDRRNRAIGEEHQGPEHKILRFAGRRDAGHPLLWVATDNNMVTDTGATPVRYAPAPAAFDLSRRAREAVMDANPWSYRVMAGELAREGKIVAGAAAGSGTVPDLRGFVFVEACTDLDDAALAFGVRVTDDHGSRWHESDRSRSDFRIVRTGCFRGAVPVPSGSGAPDAIRFRAHPKPGKPGDPRAPPGRVTLTRVNAVFRLTPEFTPGASLFEWTGTRDLTPDGRDLVLEFMR